MRPLNFPIFILVKKGKSVNIRRGYTRIYSDPFCFYKTITLSVRLLRKQGSLTASIPLRLWHEILEGPHFFRNAGGPHYRRNRGARHGQTQNEERFHLSFPIFLESINEARHHRGSFHANLIVQPFSYERPDGEACAFKCR